MFVNCQAGFLMTLGDGMGLFDSHVVEYKCGSSINCEMTSISSHVHTCSSHTHQLVTFNAALINTTVGGTVLVKIIYTDMLRKH